MRHSYSVSGLPDWLMPDLRFDPAYLVLQLWGTGQPLASNPRLIRDPDPVFAGAMMVLPRRLPAPTDAPMAVPMVLTPNLNGLVEPEPGHSEYGKAVWFKDHWRVQRFENGCYRLFIIALVPGHVLQLVNTMFSPETLAPCSK